MWSTSKWQIVNVNIYRGRLCVGKGTLYSKIMVPNGTWRMQQDVRWLPQPSASWFLLLTLKRWQLLISEPGMPSTIQKQHWTLIILCTCSLASQQIGIKKKMGSSKNVLLKRFDELKKSGMGTGRVDFKSTFCYLFLQCQRQNVHWGRFEYFIDALSLNKKTQCSEMSGICHHLI